MRTDLTSKFIVASCCAGVGLVALRAFHLVGVCLALVGGRVKQGRRVKSVLIEDE